MQPINTGRYGAPYKHNGEDGYAAFHGAGRFLRPVFGRERVGPMPQEAQRTDPRRRPEVAIDFILYMPAARKARVFRS